VKRYVPDFLVRFANGTMLVLEIKGQDTQQNRTKRGFLDEWTKAVNSHGGFGHWTWDVSFDPPTSQLRGSAPHHWARGHTPFAP